MNIEEEIIDLKARVQMLEEARKGQKWLTVVLATALAEQSSWTLSDIGDRAELAAEVAQHVAGDGAALPVQDFIAHLRALDHEGVEPLRALALYTALHADAGPERREALSTWIRQATRDELAADLLRVIREHAPPRQDQGGSGSG